MTDDVLLHAGGTAAWDISQEVLTFLRTYVKPGMKTLETGAGQSTLVFLELGADHICVTPSQTEADAIAAEAKRRGLDGTKLNFKIGYSQDVLPNLDSPLDVVLIDGGHGFPIPAVDWIYTARHLNVGGMMLIDDVDLWTGSMVIDVMKQEPEWEFVELLRGRTAAFRLIAPFEMREWTQQPTVVQKSWIPQTLRKARNFAATLLSGDFAALSKKIANERRLLEASKND